MASDSPCYKVILCGEYGSGKSSIFRRFVNDTFVDKPNAQQSIGLDHFAQPFKHDGRTILVELWDTGNIERFATLSSSYYKRAVAALLVYSITSSESFATLSQHMLDVVMNSETAKIFLCGTKDDLTGDEAVTQNHVEDFEIQCDAALSGTYRISCKTGEGIKEMFEDIARVLISEVTYKSDRTNIQLRNYDDEDKGAKKRDCC